MDCRQRVLDAARGRPTDRIPCSPRMWKFHRAYYGGHNPDIVLRSATEFGYDPIYYTGAAVQNVLCCTVPAVAALPHGVTCEATVDRGTDCDVVHRRFHTPSGSVSDVWECPHPDSGFGLMPTAVPREHLLKRSSDVACLEHLQGRLRHDGLRQFSECTASLGGRALVVPYVRSPFNDLSAVLPVDTALMLTHDDPSFLRSVLSCLQTPCLADIEAHLSAGAEMIFMSGFHISLSVGWSPATFEEFFLPLICEQAAMVHAAGALYHYYDDGRFMGVLPMLLDAGVDVVSTCTPPPAGDVDLRKARAAVGERMCLMGNIDIEHVLRRGSPQSVDTAVRDAVEAARGGPFILSTSDGILEQTPLANVRAYFSAARRYGRSGLRSVPAEVV